MRLVYFLVWMFGFPLVVGLFSYFLLTNNFVLPDNLHVIWVITALVWIVGCQELREKENSEETEDTSSVEEVTRAPKFLFNVVTEGGTKQLRAIREMNEVPEIGEYLSIPVYEDDSKDFIQATVKEVLKTAGYLEGEVEHIISFTVSQKNYEKLSEADDWEEFE